jgi:hypothetical protein
MSTTPPEEQPPRASYGIGVPSGAIMPVPGNAELVLWVIVEVILAIVAAVASDFDAHGWAVATTWLTAAYILSRGVAKASRVLER